MNIVVDTNILLAVAMDEPERAQLVKATIDAELIAPATLPFEVGNAISAMLKRRCLTIEHAMAVWDAVSVIRVRLVDIDLRAALEMAVHHEIYAYDAYVLQCGKQMRCPILTLDIALRRVGVKLGLHIMEVA
ncbi:MAG: type II toxin-antitoxin system VapC family toxin [Phycisphaerae bacterium]